MGQGEGEAEAFMRNDFKLKTYLPEQSILTIRKQLNMPKYPINLHPPRHQRNKLTLYLAKS